MNKVLVVKLLVFILPTLYGLDNGLARTPPMGWMQWERYRCITDCESYPDECISEQLFRNVADLMVANGYKGAGYEYIMIDDCWMEKNRTADDKLQPDHKRFPNGMKNLSDYIHSKGLKFGIYADYGTHTCAGYPGSIDYLKLDADTFAEWGVDYLKLDGCYADSATIENGYTRMKEFLNQTGRPIVFSCSWTAYKGLKSNYSRAAEDCNLWRNYGDIDDSWASVQSIVSWFGKFQDRFASVAGPGHWNDPDMLIIGDFGLSYEQAKAQMTLWAMMSAPLIMSVDLKKIEPQYKKILLNKDVIAIDQDPLGIQGRLVIKNYQYKNINVWTKPLTPVNGNYSYAIAIVNHRTDGYPFRVNFKLSQFNMTHPGGYFVKAVFESSVEERVYDIDDQIVDRVRPTGVTLLVATPQEK